MIKNRVLVVDDEAIVRESIRDWLKDAGYVVEIAESGEQALEMIRKQAYQVMVLDYRLPGESGMKVLTKARGIQPNLKSIIITAYPSEETVGEAKKLGAIDYLIKPLVPEDLEKLIREAIQKTDIQEAVKPVQIEHEYKEPAIGVSRLYAITDGGLQNLVEGLISEMEVIGVKAKQGKYAYGNIHRFEELQLGYDSTIMPPTKFLFPAKETLIKYNVHEGHKFEAVLDTKQRVLIGVHPDDINAIELLDEVFMSANIDPNYITRRQNTMIVGVDCLNPSPRSFAPSMGTQIADSGFDLLLTDIGIGYVVTVGTKKGAEYLAKYANPREVTGEEISTQKRVRDEALHRYQVSLIVHKERLLKLLQENYDNPYWESRSKTCLNCGSCVMVCPTCFCFDVQDEVELNLKEGQRYRSWDGCVLSDFAKVATGENFRHSKGSRFRHRMFRKGKYILEKYGMPGCVGCGRCGSFCLADIASPVEAFNAIVESSRIKDEAVRVLRGSVIENNLYVPHPAWITKITNLGGLEKLFEFKFVDGRPLGQIPGQFVEVSIPGIGEAPISVSSSPTRDENFQLAIRNVGNVTQSIHDMKEGDVLGIRGPFGNGFPLDTLKGKDLLLIAGGIGLFPLRSLIQYVLDKKEQFGKIHILLGSRAPAERMFVDEVAEWSKIPNVELLETVDKGDDDWKGNVGVITTLIPKVKIDIKKTVAVVVGPPVMYRFVINELKKIGLQDDYIVMSLERRMKCGVGKCGHCQINGVYVCQEGPVFSLEQLRSLREAVL